MCDTSSFCRNTLQLDKPLFIKWKTVGYLFLIVSGRLSYLVLNCVKMLLLQSLYLLDMCESANRLDLRNKLTCSCMFDQNAIVNSNLAL